MLLEQRRAMNTSGYRHILAGTDLGPDSQRAMRETLRIARRDQARVTVLLVVPSATDATRAKVDLNAFLLGLPDDGLDIEGHVAHGEPAACIEQIATQLRCDLIVVAATRKGPVERFWVGSIAETLVRDCALPVLVVGAEKSGGRRVLVGVGYTRQCKDALRAGYVQAFRDGGLLEAVHVGQSAGPTAVRSDPSEKYGLRAVSEGESALRTYLGVTIPRDVDGHSIEARHLVGWKPSQAIVKRALASKSTLVVLGRHRRTLKRLLFGTTGQRVMRALPCSLLVVGRPRVQ
jgi:nucleotide-binding universal stress UspA family protein